MYQQMINIEIIKHYLLELQKSIIEALRDLDSTLLIRQDQWQRPQGGGGDSCILEHGDLFEQAGVNFSHIFGDTLPEAATSKRPEMIGRRFEALGISSVIHPLNPYLPSTHLNVRFFISRKDGALPIWWFGGGFDLTPYYGFEEDAKHWHYTAQKACADYGEDIYHRYKKCCDDYFFLPHRQEARGIGGLFFDDLNDWEFDQCFAFLRSVGDAFLIAYLPIVERRKQHQYGERQRQFQLYRRGRYVEFNLLYDRGTLFGLQSGGRTESILMSLPPLVSWQYDWKPEPGSPEAELCDKYLQPHDWV